MTRAIRPSSDAYRAVPRANVEVARKVLLPVATLPPDHQIRGSARHSSSEALLKILPSCIGNADPRRVANHNICLLCFA